MHGKKFFATVALAAVLSIPAASADWFVHGTYEPDTAADAADGFMFLTPDTDPAGQKIYFNAVQNAHQTGVNPNSGAAGSNIRAFGAQTMAAYLGVWKDCNEDGFIGAVDGAISEYRSELLTTSDVCPAGSAYNTDGWVYEFLWIGPGDTTSNEENFATRRMVNDTESRVWGDFGLPDGRRPGATCAVNPLPAGTTGSTGGVINYADCILQRRIMNAADTIEGATGLQTGFDDKSNPQNSDSVLNQELPHPWYDPYHPENTGFYEENSGDAAFQTFDCASPATEVTDPTGGQLSSTEDPSGLVWDGAFDEDGVFFAVGTPAPAVGNPDGSVYDGVNNTWVGAFGCSEGAEFGGQATVEAQYGGSNTIEKGRMLHDVYFSFNHVAFNPAALDNDQNACILQDDEDLGDVPPGCEDVSTGTDGTIVRDTPQDLGLGAYRQALGLGSSWTGLPNYIREPQSVNRADGTPAGRTYATFYAFVGAATAATGAQTTGKSAVYGAPWCDGATTGIVNGWDCDASHWWNPTYDSASTAMPTEAANANEQCTTGRATPTPNCREIGVKTGQVYQLRDIDCWDGQLVRGVPAYASLVELSATGPCDRPA